MSKFSKGRTLGRYQRQRYGSLQPDPFHGAVSRRGVVAKYGPKKGSTPPGSHTNQVKGG